MSSTSAPTGGSGFRASRRPAASTSSARSAATLGPTRFGIALPAVGDGDDEDDDSNRDDDDDGGDSSSNSSDATGNYSNSNDRNEHGDNDNDDDNSDDSIGDGGNACRQRKVYRYPRPSCARASTAPRRTPGCRRRRCRR